MINGNDCVFALKLDGTNYLPVYCATSFSFNLVSNDTEVTVNSDGRFRDYAQNTFNYTLSLDGMAAIASENSSFDVLLAQMEFFTIPYRLIYEDEAGAVRSIEGECIVVSSALTAEADQGLGMSHTFQGKGNFNAFVDGEPNDGGEIPDDGGDGGGGPGEGEGDECLTVINDDILDIIIIPDAPLSYNYRVALNDIVGTWLYIAWRLDGGIWHYETSQEFVLPFLENGSYTLELAAVCANGIFGPSVIKTFDVFNEPPEVCDGTIDGWSYTYLENEDGTYTVTFTVEASSPTETLHNIQYKINIGPDAGLWITNTVTDGVSVFSQTIPSLTFEIDLRTVCSNGGFGNSVEDGGEIPEPVTCNVSIEILSYYLSYSYNTYNCEAVMTYALTGATLDEVLQIQWFNPSTSAWVDIADSTEPVIIIPVVPGTVISQQFRVACDATHFGPIGTISVSVPIKGNQLDSRVINYTTEDEYYYVYVNGTLISQGVVEDNNYTEFNYVGLLNTPVTIKITLNGFPDPAMMYFITRGFEITGLLDPADDHSVLFEDVMITYGFAIVFWAFMEEVIFDPVVTDVDYTFDPGTGEFTGTPTVTGADYYEYSTDGVTWTVVPVGDPFNLTGVEEFDYVYVRGTTADQSASGGTYTLLVEVEYCPAEVNLTVTPAMSYNETTSMWTIFPQFEVINQQTPTVDIEYWNGTTWLDLGPSDSFDPLYFEMADNSTIEEFKMRSVCTGGLVGTSGTYGTIVTPERSTWAAYNRNWVCNYAYVDQTITIKINGVTVFSETVTARQTLSLHLASLEPADEVTITTSPDYQRIPSDVPDETVTYYTQIWEGDSWIGSYAHDPLDNHTVIVTGVGVDITNGIVFTVQSTTTPA